MALTKAEIYQRFEERHPGYRQTPEYKQNALLWRQSEQGRAVRRKNRLTYQGTDKAKVVANAARRRNFAAHRLMVRTMKAQPCADCHTNYPPYVMDFDHVRGVKKARVSSLLAAPRKTLIAEIAKCDLVCANCHRIRHHGQA